MGHPTWYTPEAVQLAERGATLAEIAEAMSVTIRSLSRWKLRHSEFAAALERGRKQRKPIRAADRRNASGVEQADMELLALLRTFTTARDQREKAAAEELQAPRPRPREANAALEREHGTSPAWPDTACAPIPLDDPLRFW